MNSNDKRDCELQVPGRVAVVIPLPPSEFQPDEARGWTLLQFSLETSPDDEGKFVAAVRQKDDDRPIWRFLTPDKAMNWSRGLDGKNSIAESFRLFPDEAGGLAATRQYPATRLYQLSLDTDRACMVLIHVGDYAIPGFRIDE